MAYDGQDVVALCDGVSFRPMGETALLLRANDGQLFTLNAVGSAVVQRMDGQRALAAILDDIEQEFEAPSRAALETDVFSLLDDLESEGLVGRMDKASGALRQ